MNLTKTTLLTIASAFVSALVFSQQINSKGNQNVLNEAWTFSINPGLGFVVNSQANPGTENARIATNFSGRKYFGNVGLGITGGIMAGNISNDAVNTFLSDRNYPADATVTKSNPSNSYLLFGPAVRFGKKVQFGAELSGGLFLNDVGSFTVTPQGAPRPLYSLENGNKNLFPGFSGIIHIDYPINNSTRFFISTGYLQTKSSTRILDLQQGIDIPKLQNQDLKLFTAGIGISKSFGGRKRENSDGLSAVKRNRIGVLVDDDFESAGKVKNGGKINGSVNVGNAYRSLESKSTGGVESLLTKLSNSRVAPKGNFSKEESENCGPVTQKTTSPDGTVTETTFACPADAAQYRQSQGITFGEKVATGMQSGANSLAGNPNTGFNNDDTARNNILFGKISHWPSAADANGIVTNKSNGIGGMAAKPGGMTSSSYAAGKMSNPQNGNGIIANFYSREAGSGMATGRRSRTREAGSGMATGRRQYQLIYTDETGNAQNGDQANVVVNPLYNSTGKSGENPIFEGKSKSISSGGGDMDGHGIPELMVSLIDPVNGAVLASTKTEKGGDFYFANLPKGDYAVKIEGTLVSRKGYQYYQAKTTDVAGQILSGHDNWAVEIKHAKGTVEQAAAYVQKTRTKSNNSNDRLMGNTNDNSGLVWSPRSNFKVLPASNYDEDSDGIPDLILGNQLHTGYNNYPPVALIPGGPIKGTLVKAGKNPGGDVVAGARTNANGEFEFPNLQPGSYIITMEQTLQIDDITIVELDGDATNDDKSRKGWDGTVKGGSKLVNEPEERKGRVHKEETYSPWETDDASSKLKALNTTLDELKLQLDNSVTDNKHPDGAYKTAYSNIKDIKTAITDIQKTLENQQQKTEVLKRKVAELQEILKTIGPKFKGKDKELHNWWTD